VLYFDERLMVRNGCSRVSCRYFIAALLIAAGLLTCASEMARAASLTIVALGTSNTYGKGVARGQTYPAQLQAMLMAKGIPARVINAGINGNSSADLLARLNSAVLNGTRLVIIETAVGNESRKHVAWQTSENIAAIKSRLQARGIDSIDISSAMHSAIRAVPRASDFKQPNGHLTAVGYALLVPSLVPEVAAALGKWVTSYHLETGKEPKLDLVHNEREHDGGCQDARDGRRRKRRHE
jgi:acyl-CoA thioesterase I